VRACSDWDHSGEEPTRPTTHESTTRLTTSTDLGPGLGLLRLLHLPRLQVCQPPAPPGVQQTSGSTGVVHYPLDAGSTVEQAGQQALYTRRWFDTLEWEYKRVNRRRPLDAGSTHYSVGVSYPSFPLSAPLNGALGVPPSPSPDIPSHGSVFSLHTLERVDPLKISYTRSRLTCWSCARHPWPRRRPAQAKTRRSASRRSPLAPRRRRASAAPGRRG
jgi:hypothetical protein